MSSVAKNKIELTEAIQSTYENLRVEFQNIPKTLINEQSMEGQVKGTKCPSQN